MYSLYTNDCTTTESAVKINQKSLLMTTVVGLISNNDEPTAVQKSSRLSYVLQHGVYFC